MSFSKLVTTQVNDLSKMLGLQTLKASLPAGPIKSILGHTVGSSVAYFTILLHIKGMYTAATKTFLVVSLFQHKISVRTLHLDRKSQEAMQGLATSQMIVNAIRWQSNFKFKQKIVK